MKRAIAVCVGLLALTASARAESPVAVVEQVSGKVTGAEFMDYVNPQKRDQDRSRRLDRAQLHEVLQARNHQWHRQP